MTSLFQVGQTGNRGISSLFDDRKEVRGRNWFQGKGEEFSLGYVVVLVPGDSHVSCMAESWKGDCLGFVRAQVFGVAPLKLKMGIVGPGGAESRRSRMEFGWCLV